jgi:hypothetical protein
MIFVPNDMDRFQDPYIRHINFIYSANIFITLLFLVSFNYRNNSYGGNKYYLTRLNWRPRSHCCSLITGTCAGPLMTMIPAAFSRSARADDRSRLWGKHPVPRSMAWLAPFGSRSRGSPRTYSSRTPPPPRPSTSCYCSSSRSSGHRPPPPTGDHLAVVASPRSRLRLQALIL